MKQLTIILALITFVCVSCSNDYKVNNIVAYPTECEIEQGDSVMISVVVDYSGGEAQNADLVKIDWMSSDEGIATVSKGKVKGVSLGNAEVTVSCENKSAMCKAHVVPATPKEDSEIND